MSQPPGNDHTTDSFSPKKPLDEPQKPQFRDIHELPKAFGRYRVLARLGKGGFGMVYRALDEQLKREVAVKFTLGESLDAAWRQSFLTEAQVVAKLDHPNIVPVHDVGQTEAGDFFVVSKLIDGSDLYERIERG